MNLPVGSWVVRWRVEVGDGVDFWFGEEGGGGGDGGRGDDGVDCSLDF